MISTTRRRRLALVPLATFLVACQGPALALGGSSAEARAHADEMLGALAARFGPATRDARLEEIRRKFARYALIPARLFDDASLWTDRSASTRTLTLVGNGAPGSYRLAVAPAPDEAGDPLADPMHPGEYRRELRLTRLERNQFEWQAHDALAIGTVTGNELGRALGALFAAAEQGDESAARSAYRQQLPRTTKRLAHLFSLDTLGLAPNAGGGTDVRLVIGVHTDRLARSFPRYAAYLDKYAGPSVIEMAVYDDAGREWWRATKEGDYLRLILRVAGGALAPLAGAPERMPERVHVRIDASTKAWIFRIGVHHLVGDVLLTRTPHEKAFAIFFREEPDWELPPLVETMLHTPLRRPFEGNGAVLSFGARDAAGTQTVAVRDYQVVVEESRIMRWLGGLGNSALGDFRQGAEGEFDRFNGSVLSALRADLLAITAGEVDAK